MKIKEKASNKLKPWKILSKKDIVNNRWITVRSVNYLLPNGKELKDYYLVDKPSIVVIIPVNNVGKTFLIQEYERGVNSIGYKFPAGQIEKSERPKNAAKRELEEELGLRSKQMIYLGEKHIDPGYISSRVYYFLCSDLHPTHNTVTVNPFELFEGEWIDFSQIGSMISGNEIKNPFVIVGYTLAMLRLKNL